MSRSSIGSNDDGMPSAGGQKRGAAVRSPSTADSPEKKKANRKSTPEGQAPEEQASQEGNASEDVISGGVAFDTQVEGDLLTAKGRPLTVPRKQERP